MKSATKGIARQRIQVLFQQAKKVYHDNPKLSSHYVATARKIAMAAKIRLPTVYRSQLSSADKTEKGVPRSSNLSQLRLPNANALEKEEGEAKT
jgi:hypothetical protein